MGEGDSTQLCWPEGRRRKALIFVLACLGAGAAPHWLGPLRGLLPGLGAALLLCGYGLRTMFSSSVDMEPCLPVDGANQLPRVDVLVAARDEEAVIGRLVQAVADLDYPKDQLNLWVMNDGSLDNTAKILEGLKQHFPFLHVQHRLRDSGGGKSAALNALLPQLKADWLMVLDADASFAPDLLMRLLPHLQRRQWGALQLRKAVDKAETSWLTRSQALEMAFDAVMQEGRICSGGIGELRGNGQLLRREVLLACGGFNEDTVTDDLDLSFRLLLAGEAIGVIWNPPVQEEPVTRWGALLRQRQRWAEGGLQRYLDYWPALISNRLSIKQRLDLLVFFLLQYALPVAIYGDLFAALAWRELPLLWPLSISTVGFSALAIKRAGSRFSEGPALPSSSGLTLLIANTYLMHWFLVIPWVSLKMAFKPKRLVWAKTAHVGL
ncbi:glycosyltransferase family 2 protein [Synechococcus lacustris]|uniref:glycosyltransferase n=1 Tax=Synechococcus lacustris TaxID=2116544 RepID=UPI003341B892